MTRRWFITGGTPVGSEMACAEVALEAGTVWSSLPRTGRNAG